ncbi:transmembrane protein, partial [Cystoisospora suis]
MSSVLSRLSGCGAALYALMQQIGAAALSLTMHKCTFTTGIRLFLFAHAVAFIVLSYTVTDTLVSFYTTHILSGFLCCTVESLLNWTLLISRNPAQQLEGFSQFQMAHTVGAVSGAGICSIVFAAFELWSRDVSGSPRLTTASAAVHTVIFILGVALGLAVIVLSCAPTPSKASRKDKYPRAAIAFYAEQIAVRGYTYEDLMDALANGEKWAESNSEEELQAVAQEQQRRISVQAGMPNLNLTEDGKKIERRATGLKSADDFPIGVDAEKSVWGFDSNEEDDECNDPDECDSDIDEDSSFASSCVTEDTEVATASILGQDHGLLSAQVTSPRSQSSAVLATPPNAIEEGEHPEGRSPCSAEKSLSAGLHDETSLATDASPVRSEGEREEQREHMGTRLWSEAQQLKCSVVAQAGVSPEIEQRSLSFLDTVHLPAADNKPARPNAEQIVTREQKTAAVSKPGSVNFDHFATFFSPVHSAESVVRSGAGTSRLPIRGMLPYIRQLVARMRNAFVEPDKTQESGGEVCFRRNGPSLVTGLKVTQYGGLKQAPLEFKVRDEKRKERLEKQQNKNLHLVYYSLSANANIVFTPDEAVERTANTWIERNMKTIPQLDFLPLKSYNKEMLLDDSLKSSVAVVNRCLFRHWLSQRRGNSFGTADLLQRRRGDVCTCWSQSGDQNGPSRHASQSVRSTALVDTPYKIFVSGAPRYARCLYYWDTAASFTVSAVA